MADDNGGRSGDPSVLSANDAGSDSRAERHKKTETKYREEMEKTAGKWVGQLAANGVEIKNADALRRWLTTRLENFGGRIAKTENARGDMKENLDRREGQLADLERQRGDLWDRHFKPIADSHTQEIEKLQQTEDNLRKEVKKQKDTISELQADRRRLETAKKTADAKHEETATHARSLQQQVDSLRKDLQDAKDDKDKSVAQVTRDLDISHSNYDLLNESKNNLSARLDETNLILLGSRAANDSLRDELTVLQNEKDSFKNQVEALQTEKDAAEAQIRELEEKNHTLQQQVGSPSSQSPASSRRGTQQSNDLKGFEFVGESQTADDDTGRRSSLASIAESPEHQAALKDLQDQLNEKEKALAEAENQVTDLEGQIRKLQDDKTSAEAEGEKLDEREKELAEKQEALTDCNATVEALGKQVMDLQNQLRKAEADAAKAAADAKAAYGALQAKLAAVQAQLQTAQDQHAAATTGLDSLRKEVDRLKKEVERLKKELQAAKDKHDALDAQVNNLQTQLKNEKDLRAEEEVHRDDLESRLTQLQRQLEDTRKKQAETYAQGIESAEYADNLKKEVDRLKLEVADLEEAKAAGKQVAQELQKEIDDLQKQLGDAQKQKAAADAQGAGAGADADKLKKEVSRLKKEIADLKKQLQAAKTRGEARDREHEQKLADVRKQLEDAEKKQQAAADDQGTGAAADADRLGKEVDRLKKEIADLKKQLEAAKAQGKTRAQELVKKLADLKSQLAAAEDKNKAPATDDVARLQAVIDSLQNELAAARADVAAKEQAVKDAEARADAAERDFIAQHDKFAAELAATLKDMNDEVKADLRDAVDSEIQAIKDLQAFKGLFDDPAVKRLFKRADEAEESIMASYAAELKQALEEARKLLKYHQSIYEKTPNDANDDDKDGKKDYDENGDQDKDDRRATRLLRINHIKQDIDAMEVGLHNYERLLRQFRETQHQVDAPQEGGSNTLTRLRDQLRQAVFVYEAGLQLLDAYVHATEVNNEEILFINSEEGWPSAGGGGGGGGGDDDDDDDDDDGKGGKGGKGGDDASKRRKGAGHPNPDDGNNALIRRRVDGTRFLAKMMADMTSLAATARESIVGQLDEQIGWHEGQERRRRGQMDAMQNQIDGDKDDSGDEAAGLPPPELRRRNRELRIKVDALAAECDRLQQLLSALRDQRDWTHDVVEFAEGVRERGRRLLTAQGTQTDANAVEGGNDGEDDGNHNGDNNDRGQVSRGIQVGFGGNNWGVRQTIRCGSFADCCGGGPIMGVLNAFAILAMLFVIVAEGREYSAWRNANAVTRGLYLQADDHLFYVKLPNLGLFWEWIAYIVSGRFIW